MAVDIAAVRTLLPPDATDNGWDDAEIILRWKGSVFRTVREYWVDRVNQTAGYLDLSQDGLPASQIYQHAMEQLKYWDEMCGGSASLAEGRGTRIKTIRRG